MTMKPDLDPVTRKEYEGLFNAIMRLTDRIEALEKAIAPLGFRPGEVALRCLVDDATLIKIRRKMIAEGRRGLITDEDVEKELFS